MFLSDFIRFVLDLLLIAPSSAPFFVPYTFSIFEIKKDLKRENRASQQDGKSKRNRKQKLSMLCKSFAGKFFARNEALRLSSEQAVSRNGAAIC
jgi:hypothetical protein